MTVGGREGGKDRFEKRVADLADEAAEGGKRGQAEGREEGEQLFSSEWYAAEMKRRNDEGKYSLALTYWERIHKEGMRPCPAAYTQVLRACRYTGEIMLALALLQEMEDDGGADLYAGREGGREIGREGGRVGGREGTRKRGRKRNKTHACTSV